jgi:hydrogenase expression/formation protein HypC
MGIKRDVALDLVPAAKIGDYVLVHAGYGIEIVSQEFAQETIDLIREFPELIEQSA